MIITGSASVAGTVPLVTVPPGPCSLTLTAAGTAFIGTSGSVSTTNGYPVTSNPVTVPGFDSSRGGTVYATAAGTVTTGWLLSTPE